MVAKQGQEFARQTISAMLSSRPKDTHENQTLPRQIIWRCRIPIVASKARVALFQLGSIYNGICLKPPVSTTRAIPAWHSTVIVNCVIPLAGSLICLGIHRSRRGGYRGSFIVYAAQFSQRHLAAGR